MPKNNKDIFVLCIAIVAAVSIALAVNTTIKSDKLKRAFEKEMAFRLDSEERVTKLRNEKLDLTNQIKDRDLEIKKLKANTDLLLSDLTKTEEELTQVRKDLQTMTLLKDKLEESLKGELSKQVQ